MSLDTGWLIACNRPPCTDRPSMLVLLAVTPRKLSGNKRESPAATTGLTGNTSPTLITVSNARTFAAPPTLVYSSRASPSLLTGNTSNELRPPLRPSPVSSFSPIIANASTPTPTVPWVKPDSNLLITACAQASE
ncbi:hypothetical protein D9M71_725860 [compost metagenome]